MHAVVIYLMYCKKSVLKDTIQRHHSFFYTFIDLMRFVSLNINRTKTTHILSKHIQKKLNNGKLQMNILHRLPHSLTLHNVPYIKYIRVVSFFLIHIS